MRELSLNILDIAQNSITADAKKIDISVIADVSENKLTISVADDGKGMSQEFLAKVTDPFTTTRTTRKVGLGIPLFRQGALDAGGSFDIKSQQGKGTTVTATYQLDHIDRMPLGNLTDTMVILLLGNDNLRFVLDYQVDGRKFHFDTDEIREQIGDISFSEPSVLEFIKEYLNQNINMTNGGIL